MLGPLLPTLIDHWHIRDAQAGTLFVTLFFGQLTGAGVATFDLRLSLRLGALLTAAGVLAMAWAGFAAAHAALFCTGLGLGAGLTAGNVIAGTVFSAARARWLTILNIGWSLGAIFSPVLLRFCRLPLFFFVLTALLLLAGLGALLLSPFAPSQSASRSRALPLSGRLLAAFSVALMLYVGIENALGGWLPSYAVRVSPLLLASSISLYYWLAELAGRSLVASVMHPHRESLLFRVSLLLLIGAGLGLILIPHPGNTSVIVLTLLVGLGVAPLYPLLVSFLLSRTGQHPRLGPLFASASFGGALLPWLTGVISTHFYGLRAGLLIPTAGAILLLALSPTLVARPDHQ